MTIKARNRFNLIFTIVAITVSILQALFIFYELYSDIFMIPNVYLPNNSNIFIFSYKPLFVIIGIFVMDFYIIVTSFLINENFEKTQSTEIIFFLLFLTACLCDSMRLLVPLLQVSDTFSRLLMQTAFVPLFARILAPLALLGTTILTEEEARHNVDRNCVFIIITSLFFAKLIPFNTAIILPNLCVSYGYTVALRYSSFFICLASISALFFSNKKNGYYQITTIGLALISIGYSALFYCYNLFHLIVGSISLFIGTYLYLKNLHKQYLWLD